MKTARAERLNVVGKPPPSSIAAECVVLATLLKRNEAINEIGHLIDERNFSTYENRQVFRQIRLLIERGNVATIVSVAEALREKDENNDWLEFIGRLVKDTPDAKNLKIHVEEIRSQSAARLAKEIVKDIDEKCNRLHGPALFEALTAAAGELLTVKDRYSNNRPDRPQPISWKTVHDNPPPARSWIIPGWLSPRTTGLISGNGGIGKSLLIQQELSSLTLGRSLVSTPPRAFRTAGWFAEDSSEELARRQIAIASAAGLCVTEFDGKFFASSFDDRDMTLIDKANGGLISTSLMKELREFVHDFKLDLITLDNISRVFGGDENNRHEVTLFSALLREAVGDCAVLLVGHIAKAETSEFSGSTAWENAVRSRWYLGRKLPDRAGEPEAADESEALRYLCRRKSNYSARDYIRLNYANGAFYPEEAPAKDGLTVHILKDRAKRVVKEGLGKLIAMGQTPTDSSNSGAYLPKLLLEFRLSEGLPKRDLTEAMRELMLDGVLTKGVVGQYANRNPKMGLVICTK